MRDRDVPEIASLGLCARHRFDVPVPGREGEQDPRLPVDLLVGQAHHPCLGLVAGVHGDEYDGIVALQGLASDIIPAELQGALLIVPVANPFAFGVGRRRTPEDAQDLNRVFPGDRDGSLSERLAALLSREILLQADAVFTLHGSGANGVLSPWIEFLDVPGAVGRASYEMARSSGFDDLIALDRLPGRLLTAMGDLGVPLIEGEVGGRGTTRRENVRYYRERVYAVARHQGILPSPNGAASDEAPRWMAPSAAIGSMSACSRATASSRSGRPRARSRSVATEGVARAQGIAHSAKVGGGFWGRRTGRERCSGPLGCAARIRR